MILVWLVIVFLSYSIPIVCTFYPSLKHCEADYAGYEWATVSFGAGCIAYGTYLFWAGQINWEPRLKRATFSLDTKGGDDLAEQPTRVQPMREAKRASVNSLEASPVSLGRSRSLEKEEAFMKELGWEPPSLSRGASSEGISQEEIDEWRRQRKLSSAAKGRRWTTLRNKAGLPSSSSEENETDSD